MSEKKVLISAKDIDIEGQWHYDGKVIPLLGNYLPVPDSARLEGDPAMQEVLALLDSADWFSSCPQCKSEEPTGAILFTNYTKLFASHCCETTIWLTNKRDYSDIYES